MRAKLAIAAVLSALSALAPASAHAGLCERLREQLTEMREVTGNTAEVRRYVNALAHQDMNIRKVRGDLQRYGCSSASFTVFGGDNAAACDQLQASLSQMEENRSYLEDQRNALKSNVSGNAGERRRLQNALRDNGCNGENGDVREASFVTPSPVETQESEFYTRIPSPGEPGRLRTMCVRTCDGAFFPISSNASTSDFRRDAAICSNMCPGAETKLYYHAQNDSESADMVSATTGEPYRALPMAFAYRNRLPGEKPACGCGAHAASFSPAQGDDDAKEASRDLRPALPEKPVKPQAPMAEAAAATVPDRPYDPASSKVRVIGPQFVPSTTGALRPNG